MYNLIKNELIKIIKKRNIVIMIFLSLAFILFNNIVYKFANNIYKIDVLYNQEEIKAKEEEIKTLKLVTKEDKEYYSSLMSDIETYNILKKYDKSNWKYYVVRNNIPSVVEEMNYYKYVDKDDIKYNEKTNEYNSFLKKINVENWIEYAKIEKSNFENKKHSLEQSLNIQSDKDDIYLIKEEINSIDYEIKKINTRINNNIEYADDFINEALENYIYDIPSFDEYNKQRKDELSNNYDEYEAKKEYIELVNSNYQNKYIIENKKDINSFSSLRSGIMNFFNDYELFIIVITVIITGSVVSSEFDKGTIKLLLIRPFSRSKILLSKFISVIIVMLMAIILLFGLEFIIGGIFFGFDTIKTPVIIYNFKTNNAMQIGIFRYILSNGISILPKFILLTTLAFSLSTIINNTAIAIAIPIIGSMVGNIVNALYSAFKLSFIKYFVTLNWDLSSYLYGNIGPYSNSNIIISILICLIYFTIMIVLSFIVFNKRNIKNI